jgi:hypothetical protein
MSSTIISIIIYFLINSVISISNHQTKTINQLNINLDHGENDTILLFYNITTNYSYFITFRLFGGEQLKFGLFPPTNKFEEKFILISYQYLTTESVYLFIVCFHFILQFNDLDIHCKDIRLFKKDQINSDLSKVFLPSYNPLFVPMMYALSILMLLPVAVQHHRNKEALLLKRRNTLKRLSLQIAQDDENPQQDLAKTMLSQIVKYGNIDYKNIPMEMELLSIPSTKAVVNDNNITFGLQNIQPFTYKYHDTDMNEQLDVNADDCIAHLLDNTPWNTPDIYQPLTTSLSKQSAVRDCATAVKDQHVPTIIPFYDDDDNDQKPILKSKKYPAINLHKTNRVFFETDV